jgi:hypothetical protein
MIKGVIYSYHVNECTMPIKHTPGRKRGGPKGRQPRDHAAWAKLPISESGKTVRFQFYISTEMRDRMEAIAPMLVKMEKNKKGSGIKKNAPGLFSAYCAKTITISLEKLIATYAKEEK